MKRVIPYVIVLLLLVVIGLSYNEFGDEDKNIQVLVPERVIFITIDTLRADHLESYGYIRNTAPFIESLVDQGVLFQNAFTACSHTAPSHASMFTSLFPYQHGVLENGLKLSGQIWTMQSLFRDMGYKTAAFSAVRFLNGLVGFDRLDERYNWPMTKTTTGKFWYRPARQNLKRVLAWLEDHPDSKKFLLWLHFFDVHQWQSYARTPTEFLQKMESFDGEVLWQFITDKHRISPEYYNSKQKLLKSIHSYDARINYVDDQIKLLYEYMTSVGLNDSTLWIITSDHGEGLGNHNYDGHGRYLYNEQLRIPLIFHYPAHQFPAKVVPELVRTIDLLPTLADMMDVDVSQNSQGEGVSLMPLLTDTPENFEKIKYAFAQRRPKDSKLFHSSWEDGEVYSLQNLKHKFIHCSEAQDEFFEFETDPFELNNLIESNTDQQNTLQKLLLQILKSPPREHSNEEMKLDEETLQELDALGYVGE
ncbi:sulfatase [candidate division CSSED10-310 bacterium]|uniref:Sulfatase n=1 Tax=candidate division CSSED10-310 bacterium TaxID=2855610 RepID=A0ABV6Z0I6_UNCC1